MALTIAQARADAMLDRNCTPEPLRTGLRAAMVVATSGLRPVHETVDGYYTQGSGLDKDSVV
ncbi:MAG: hypothetical protein LBD43_02815 [Holosporales bacterium]|jgi:hypothetical protein|nr:hypothetical protein [Holosporales bacterium]